jgi:ribulose-phosphate 3-epimerase
MVKINASVICMDPIRIYEQVKFCDELGVDSFHMDIMDGNCVPRYGIYPEIVNRISNITEKPIDLHLMVRNVDFAIDEFAGAPTLNRIFFHIGDNLENCFRIIDKIRSKDIEPGLVFNLSTSFDSVHRILRHDEIDSFMFMGILPGVLKQESKPNQLIKDIPYFLSNLQYKPSYIQCDGGVSYSTVKSLVDAGANHLVCGSSTLFSNVNFTDSIENQLKLITENYLKLRNLIN